MQPTWHFGQSASERRDREHFSHDKHRPPPILRPHRRHGQREQMPKTQSWRHQCLRLQRHTILNDLFKRDLVYRQEARQEQEMHQLKRVPHQKLELNRH